MPQVPKRGPKKPPGKPKIRLPKGGDGPKRPSFWSQLAVALLVFLALISLYSFFSGQEDVEEIPLSELAREIQAGNVEEIVVRGDAVEVTRADDEMVRTRKEAGASLSETLSNYGVNLSEHPNISLSVQDPTGLGYWLVQLAPFIIPVLLILFFIWILTRQVRGTGMQAFSFGQSRARMIDPKDESKKITFDDVAGVKEAKEELKEIVDFLKHPKKYINIGAEIPKGVLLMGAPGTGKCVTGETLIETNKGLIPIADIPKYYWVDPSSGAVSGVDLPSFTIDDCENVTKSASHWYNLGEQETQKIVLKQGVEIEGTPEHPVVVLNKNGKLEFKKITQIEKGDAVAVKYGSEAYGSSDAVTEEQAYIMGLLTGDGNMSHSSKIQFTSVDKELVTTFRSYVEEQYPDSKFQKLSDGMSYAISSWKAKKDFYHAGMSYLLSYDKVMPPTILQAPKRVIVAFLQGLFDTDGSFERYAVKYSTVSKALSDQILYMLLNMGVNARRRVKAKKDDRHPRFVYEISISGNALEIFASSIGFRLQRKQEALMQYLSAEKKSNTNVDVFPHINHIVLRTWEELHKRRLSKDSMSKLAHKLRSRKNISRSSLRKFLAFCEKVDFKNDDTQYLTKLINSKLSFSPVIKKEKSRGEVYDFTVPETHSFISNGVISHNTLLARAVAGEADVPFFSMSGSEFVEMFVGVGASRVRDTFQVAKKSAPSIIFIDEIDAVGRTRGIGVGGGNDEREQTLNQILVELDGFEPNEQVIVMAATNRPDVLDPALLRPGRFDRRVRIDLPDLNDREKILEVHARKKPLEDDVNLRTIAERTPGFSGADLQSLMNEAAILAARDDRKKVRQSDLTAAIEKVMLGPERRSHLLSDEEKRITAYHEAGHALVASVLPYAHPVHKISIISRGHAAGYTLHLPTEEKRFQSRKEFKDTMAVMLGGYVTELEVFGDLTTGPSNDLERITERARDMVTKYGMSETIGPIALETDTGKALYGRGSGDHEYSENIASLIDSEVSKIIDGARAKAHKIITEKRSVLDALAQKLLEKETMERKEFESFLKEHGIEVRDELKMGD